MLSDEPLVTQISVHTAAYEPSAVWSSLTYSPFPTPEPRKKKEAMSSDDILPVDVPVRCEAAVEGNEGRRLAPRPQLESVAPHTVLGRKQGIRSR